MFDAHDTKTDTIVSILDWKDVEIVKTATGIQIVPKEEIPRFVPIVSKTHEVRNNQTVTDIEFHDGTIKTLTGHQ